MPADESRTDMGLLFRVRRDNRDHLAWSDFVDRYAPKIYAWCRAWRLQEADAQDVTQAVLMQLARKMERFRYDPGRSFRGWLRKLTENAWRDWLAERRRGVASGGDLATKLDQIEARDDLIRRLEQEFDLELLEEAVIRVRERVAPTTWEAYRLTAIEEASGAEAAHRLGMTVESVHQARSRVLGRLREEIRALERPSPVSADHK